MRSSKFFAGAVIAFASLAAVMPEANATPVFADISAITPTTFSGTLGGVAFTGTATNFAPFSITTGSANFFSGSAGTFSPTLPTSDSLGFMSAAGFSITFAQPVHDLLFNIYSLGNTLDFGTPVTLLSTGPIPSGGTNLSVSGTQLIGTSDGGGNDSSGTVLLSGTFSSLTVTSLTSNSDGAGLIFGTPVPEPTTISLIVGWGLLMLRQRKRRS